MINAKNELQFLLVTSLLERMAVAGFLTEKELVIAKRLAVEKYRPIGVWE